MEHSDEKRTFSGKNRGASYRRAAGARKKKRNQTIAAFRYWQPCDAPKFLKEPNYSDITKPMKRRSNRAIRRKKEIQNGFHCHKHFQYWMYLHGLK